MQLRLCIFLSFFFFYLQYTNLRGRQVRLLPLFQLFLRVDLPIKQSDRKAPDKYINEMIKLAKWNKNRGGRQTNVSGNVRFSARTSRCSPANEAEDIEGQVEYGEGSEGDEKQHDSKTPPSPDGQTGLENRAKTVKIWTILTEAVRGKKFPSSLGK